jgi:hypothetical protein
LPTLSEGCRNAERQGRRSIVSVSGGHYEAAVARPDPQSGETPCAFGTLTPDAPLLAAEDVVA